MENKALKNLDYFNTYLKKQYRRVATFEKVFDSQKVECAHELSLRLSIFLAAFNIPIAKFSARHNISDIKESFSLAIQKLSKSDFKIGYCDSLWLLSLAILLEISNEDFNKIVTAIDTRAYNNEDQLLDYLIAYRIPNRKINDSLQFPKPYASLISATTWGKSIAQTTLKTYLEKKWYPGHSDCGWHDSHKSPHNTYFGYWSFETAAIVKIMELDDSSFKDNQYYPYDLVHWKES